MFNCDAWILLKRATRATGLFVLVAILVMEFNPTESMGADESVEPPQTYSVTVGEKSITISDGESVQLDGTFINPKITITPAADRLFQFQGLKFKYPKTFNFEADLKDPDVKHWTLSGNNLTIMYFVFKETVSTAEFGKNMISSFGRNNATIVNTNASISLGNQKLSGISLELKVASHRSVMDIYQIPTSDKTTKMLVFQDSLDDAGKHSQECEKTLAQINASLSIEK